MNWSRFTDQQIAFALQQASRAPRLIFSCSLIFSPGAPLSSGAGMGVHRLEIVEVTG